MGSVFFFFFLTASVNNHVPHTKQKSINSILLPSLTAAATFISEADHKPDKRVAMPALEEKRENGGKKSHRIPRGRAGTLADGRQAPASSTPAGKKRNVCVFQGSLGVSYHLISGCSAQKQEFTQAGSSGHLERSDYFKAYFFQIFFFYIKKFVLKNAIIFNSLTTQKSFFDASPNCFGGVRHQIRGVGEIDKSRYFIWRFLY